MPPRLNLLQFARPLPYRPKPQVPLWGPQAPRPLASPSRSFSDAKDQATSKPVQKHSEQLDSVSQEAAKTAEITGFKGPDVDAGTPVEEVCQIFEHLRDSMG